MITTIILLAGAFAMLLGGFAVRQKLRKVWGEIWCLRARIDALQREVISAQKEIVLQRERDRMRLPAKMPSQNGEDLVLWRFFDHKRDGFFVEIGAYDGVELSNSYFFEAIGWDGILVEAAPDLATAALRSRPFSRCLHAAVGSVGGTARFNLVQGVGGVDTLSFTEADVAHRDRVRREGGSVREIDVPQQTLDTILGDLERPIDFVSIDVEGGELGVLNGFSIERYRPRVLVVEDNSGGRDRRVPVWLADHGYVERLRVEQNVFYCQVTESRQFQ